MSIPRIGIAVTLICALAACGTQPAQTSASPRSPSQLKQQELQQMEAVGQRNDFDKPFKN